MSRLAQLTSDPSSMLSLGDPVRFMFLELAEPVEIEAYVVEPERDPSERGLVLVDRPTLERMADLHRLGEMFAAETAIALEAELRALLPFAYAESGPGRHFSAQLYDVTNFGGGDFSSWSDQRLIGASARLGESLALAVDAAREALETLAVEIQRAGGRSSRIPEVATFAAYHLADLEGRAGDWLGRGFLVDELRALGAGKAGA